jgi:hypothetical protein
MNTVSKVRPARPTPTSAAMFLISVMIGLAACSTAPAVLTDFAVPGWSPLGDTRSFDEETLFDYANGGSEFFFQYGFEQMTVRRYGHASGAEMTAETWRLATSDDAYGLFSQSGVETPIRIENVPNAALDTGSLLCFWQDRYYVLLRATQTVPDDDLVAFARAISSTLPPGGSPPALVAMMPADPRPEGAIVFFREEMVIQDSLYLGGENVLGLSQQTRAVLARYPIGEETIKVILVEYPDAASATSASEALQAGGVDALRESRVTSTYLYAAFGNASRAEAEALLDAISIP